ncbi:MULTISPECIES: GumC family protein [unclassified Haematobacter]|uniref:GumC family protein n=1 Tax=unclassified Haematobacter TaxID=2640585 RepID=UPI0025B83DD7|nr:MULTISPECIES: Wzz/FepE/Etk N-terminal domain-containing protein [unclassified Haematobacter]
MTPPPRSPALPSASDRPLTLAELATMIREHWRLILMVAAVAAVTALGYLMMTGPAYVASTKMLVKVGREKFSALQVAQVPQQNVIFQERPQSINNEIEILRDPTLTHEVFADLQAKQAELAAHDTAASSFVGRLLGGVAGVVKTAMGSLRTMLGLGAGKHPEEKIAQAYMDAFNVNYIKETDIIQAEFAWDDPRFAAYALQRYLDAYQARHVAIHSSTASADFYRDQVTLAERDLRGAEDAFSAFQRSSDMSRLDVERDLALTAISEMEKDRDRLQAEMEDLRQTRAQVTADFNDGAEWVETPAMLNATPLTALDESYVAASTERSRLASRYSDDAREVREVTEEIAGLRERKHDTLNRQIDGLLRSSGERMAQVEARIADRRAALQRINEGALQFESLGQNVTRQRERLEEYQRQYERLRMNEALDRLNVTSTAQFGSVTVPVEPAAPKRSLVLAIGGIFGLLAGTALAIFLGLTDRRLRRPGDVERRLGLPVVATVPRLS